METRKFLARVGKKTRAAFPLLFILRALAAMYTDEEVFGEGGRVLGAKLGFFALYASGSGQR